jgi:hypothetical protein
VAGALVSARVFEELQEDPPEGLTGDALVRWYDRQNKKAIIFLLVGQDRLNQNIANGIALLKWFGGSTLAGVLIDIVFFHILRV